MNNRMIKKREKMRRKEIVEIFDLALQVNGLGERKKEITGEQPTVFCEFSGHVASIAVDIFEQGYQLGGGSERYLIYTDKTHFNYKKFTDCRQRLIEIRNSVVMQP